ncbi:site-specific integrase [Flavonifractor plautii]|jgi:integrase/recombinase XerD|uniref:site-specific integrase n=1 Tax=Flavonifractor plautii TaxID=292800 RepID=UPI003D6F28C1
MKPTGHILPAAHVQRYAAYLREQERAPATIQKYVRDLTALLDYLDGQPLTKAALIGWKEHLTACHAPTTVNSMLAALNGFLNFMGWRECAVKLLKIQKSLFCDEHRELTRAEYARLVSAAQRRDNERLSLVM